jgi:hypothetical protein
MSERRLEPAALTLSLAQSLTGDSRLKRWWESEEGFQDWLRDKDELTTRLEYLIQLSLSSVEDVLLSSDPKTANAKVQILKTLLEATGKMQSRQVQVKYADAEIEKLSAPQLRAFIEQQQKKLGPAPGGS